MSRAIRETKSSIALVKYTCVFAHFFLFFKWIMLYVNLIITTLHPNLDHTNTVSRWDIGAVGDAMKILIKLEEERNISPNSPKFLPFNIKKDLKVCP